MTRQQKTSVPTGDEADARRVSAEIDGAPDECQDAVDHPETAGSSADDELGPILAEGLDATIMGSVDDDERDAAVPDAPDDQLVAIIEALIFASPEPIALKALAKTLDAEPLPRVSAAVDVLRRRYDDRRGLQLVEVANGFQIVTRPELHEWVRRLFHERTTQKLSVAALETLAVIAYKQPVTAAEIAEIRSVNTSGVLGTLIDRKLVKIAGRKAVVGRPFMYATTREFLERFGLRDLNDLPRVEDMADVLGFDPPILDDLPSVAALPFDAAGEEAATAGAPEAGAADGDRGGLDVASPAGPSVGDGDDTGRDG